ncbi:D-alanyl-D-alanine carboxypeptidase [Paenibacillus pasadenensis]|uniref:D-alanyl-D-alanine carboxypeptidase family protein n=1 Tax=Paenibacillus pasadenensis TaxID=217090 RepID=UPI00203B2C93|nr:D-alanyl-D-alanine carboxypeptidase family protein [Paenibacillus pasadenensis]MCM3750341.1 D-alanyl-D-alanine carboxypeptidase [Paenibacillus pasadenensis]
MKARFAPALIKPAISAFLAVSLFAGSSAVTTSIPAAYAAATNTTNQENPAAVKQDAPFFNLPAQNPSSNPLDLALSAAILIDADTGQLLYSHNIDKVIPPASMTKMMTEYMVLKAIKDGKLAWDQEVSISKEAASTPADGSQIYLAEGDTHSVKELYTAMAVASANDATVALGNAIAGTEAEFVKLMNEQAKELGLSTAVFTSSTGYLDTTVAAAKDIAKLAAVILKEHPEFLEYSKIPSVKFRERDEKPMVNNDWMLESNKGIESFKQYTYDGVDGMKTGFLSASGYNFTGTVKRGDTRLISVVYGANSKGKRFLETRKLYDWAFTNLERKTIVQAKSVVDSAASAKIAKGKSKTVDLVTGNDLTLMVKKGSTSQAVLKSTKLPGDGELVAPIKAGDKVGTATYEFKDPDTGVVVTKELDLVAAEDVAKAGWFSLLMRSIGGFFSGLFQGIVNLF